jgi:hypothetical protein
MREVVKELGNIHIAPEISLGTNQKSLHNVRSGSQALYVIKRGMNLGDKVGCVEEVRKAKC